MWSCNVFSDPELYMDSFYSILSNWMCFDPRIIQKSLLGYLMDISTVDHLKGFPGGSEVRVHLQCRRSGFDPWGGKIPWRREWQPTPVFLPGKLHGQRTLAGYSPWGCRIGHDWWLTCTCILNGYKYKRPIESRGQVSPCSQLEDLNSTGHEI